MAKIEEALRAEVPTLSSQTWYEALNQVGVEASSLLRKAKIVYYPPASGGLFPPFRGLMLSPRGQR